MTVEILRIHEDHVTQAMFTIIQNGLLVLVGTKC